MLYNNVDESYEVAEGFITPSEASERKGELPKINGSALDAMRYALHVGTCKGHKSKIAVHQNGLMKHELCCPLFTEERFLQILQRHSAPVVSEENANKMAKAFNASFPSFPGGGSAPQL